MIMLFTSFRLFADDVKIFYTSDDINDIESVMNCEMIEFSIIIPLISYQLTWKIFNKSSSIPSLFYDSLRAVSDLHKNNTTDHRPKVKGSTLGNLPLLM